MSILLRVVRRLVLRVLRLGIRRRRGLLTGALAVSTLLVASALNLVPLPRLGPPSGGGGSADGRPHAEGEPTATAMYLKGQESYNAQLVWDAYSERAIREAQRRGLSVDDTQRQLDRARQAGTRIEQINYVGGYPISNGSMHFYIVFRSDTNRREATPVPYVFTLDTSGKIDYVE